MRVFMEPKENPGNKYNHLLSNALEQKGAEVIALNKKTIIKVSKGDIVHFHWPSHLYSGNSPVSSLVKGVTFFGILSYFKLKRAKIVWTMHNVWPHNMKRTPFQKRYRTLVCSFMDKIIIMNQGLTGEISREFNVDPGKIDVVKHGHYIGEYPSKQIDVRKQLGIKETDFVYGFIGAISPYKGVEDLIEQFQKIEGDHLKLLICGKVSKSFNKEIFDSIRDERIILKLEFIPDDELHDYLKALDAMVLPYKVITNSGSAILALSHHVPLVIPDVETLREYIPDGCAVYFNKDDPAALRSAMQDVTKLDEQVYVAERAKQIKELSWENIAGQTIEAYESTFPLVAREKEGKTVKS